MVHQASDAFRDLRGVIRFANGSQEEARAILEWENVSRRFSFNPEKIDWKTHWAWYQGMRLAERSLLLVAEDIASELVGSVTFKSEDGHVAKIGVIVRPSFRGLGWGQWIVENACKLAFRLRSYQQILATVYSENVSSMRTFRAAGFREMTEVFTEPMKPQVVAVVTFEYVRPAVMMKRDDR